MTGPAELVTCDQTIEHCVNRLKLWRGIATRLDKRAANYRAVVVIASLPLWLDA
jgi:transposase